MLIIDDLEFGIDEKEILKKISLKIKRGSFVGIIGANGCGKSTLLKNIYRFLNYEVGSIKLEDRDLKNYKPKELAKKISVLSQKNSINFDFTVEEIVEMGRYAHESSIFCRGNKDEIKKALLEVGMYEYRNKSFTSLSGGELQRVLIARALAQKSEMLILDEPTNHLDIKYQIQIMDLVKKVSQTTLAVIHDMNLASFYCDYIFAMKEGKIVVEGSPEEMFTVENIKKIFDMECQVTEHPIRNKPLITF